MVKLSKKIDGVVIGIFLGFGDAESPLVVFADNPADTALQARSMTELTAPMIGAQVALLFEAGDPRRPIIVGRIVDAVRRATPEVTRDGETVTIVGQERIELRCGKARIVMEKDGRITIRGTYLTSHASATNRVRGGSVNLN